jgi:hypothetical protein
MSVMLTVSGGRTATEISSGPFFSFAVFKSGRTHQMKTCAPPVSKRATSAIVNEMLVLGKGEPDHG